MLSLGSCEACGWLDLRLLISNQNHGSLGLLHSVSRKYDNSLIILYLCHDMKLGQRNKVLQIRALGVLSLFLRVCFFPGFCALIPHVSLLPSLSFEGHRDVPWYREWVSSDIMSKIPVHHTLE